MEQRRVVVDVWVAPVDTDLPGWHADVLDASERARAAALPEHAASRFVLDRLLLRTVLGERLGCAPRDVVARASCSRCGGAHGRVTVGRPAGGASDRWPGEVHVGLTRSGPVVAVALCESGPVGIDAESRGAVAAAPLADVVLSPRELARRRGTRGAWTGPGEQSLATVWVRKEAALKALGTGLVVDPSSVELARPPRRAVGVDAVVGDSVAVADLRLGRGAVGAVAVVAPDVVRHRRPWGSGGRRLVVRRHDGASALTTPPG